MRRWYCNAMRESRRLPPLKPNPSEAQLPRDSSYIYTIKTKHIVPKSQKPLENYWKEHTYLFPRKYTLIPEKVHAYPRESTYQLTPTHIFKYTPHNSLYTYIIARIYRKEFFIYKSTAQSHTESILATPGLWEITYISQTDYSRSSFQLHTSPRVSIPVSPRNYVPIL